MGATRCYQVLENRFPPARGIVSLFPCLGGNGKKWDTTLSQFYKKVAHHPGAPPGKMDEGGHGLGPTQRKKWPTTLAPLLHIH